MCIVTAKNLTSALKCRDILLRVGIGCEIISVDPAITKRGCSYGVSFSCDKESDVRRQLKKSKVDYGEIIGYSRRTGWYS